jgi:hypothetical protein
MSPAFWFTLQINRRCVRVPLPLLLPLALVVDLLAAVALLVVALRTRRSRWVRVAALFALSRLTLALILHAGRLRIAVRDGAQGVQLHGGWR